MSTGVPDDQPAESAPQPVTADAPDWARELKQTIEALPGKLKASLSDDDKNGIAEAVHGLFERSGAFVTPEEASTEAEQETTATEQETEQTTTEPPPKKHGKATRFAQWFSGEE